MTEDQPVVTALDVPLLASFPGVTAAVWSHAAELRIATGCCDGCGVEHAGCGITQAMQLIPESAVLVDVCGVGVDDVLTYGW